MAARNGTQGQGAGGPPQQAQMVHSGPQFPAGAGASLSLAQCLGQVLSSFNGALASELDVDARMREHPQGKGHQGPAAVASFKALDVDIEEIVVSQVNIDDEFALERLKELL